MFDPKRILILAPHTDDGELGCGGSIARFSQEHKEVYYAAFSTCSKSLPASASGDTLEKECRSATRELGIDASRLVIFDFEVREFPARRQAILEELIRLNMQLEPDLVFLPSAHDIHQDHQVIQREGLRAFKNKTVLGYELPWNQREFHANFYLRLSKEQLDRKVNAIGHYQSQAHRNYMQEDFIRSLARVRGIQSGNDWAEAFTLYHLLA